MNIFGMGIMTLILFPGFLLLISGLLQWLWNITIPGIFNVREITFWEAFRLILITGILFGSNGRGINFNM